MRNDEIYEKLPVSRQSPDGFRNQKLLFTFKKNNYKNIPHFILQQFIGRINALHTR